MKNDAEELFQQLMTSHHEMICRVCRRHSGRDEYHYRDLYQEVAVAVWNECSSGRVRRLRCPDKLTPWLYRVAMNTAAGYFRRRAAEREQLSLAAEQADELLQPCHLTDNEVLDDLIARLPACDRRLLLLHLQGYGYDDIAAMEQLSATAVATRLSRIRARLREVARQLRPESAQQDR